MRALKQRSVVMFLLVGLLALATSMSAYATNPPVANMSQSPNLKGAMPLLAKFDGSASNCNGFTGFNACSNYQWNFGDGSVDSGSSLSVHNYTAAGTYSATLTVTDNAGRKASATQSVIVTPAESLASYVAACETQLNFQSISSPDADLDCYDGDLFAPSTGSGDPVNDYLVYKKINDQVDMAMACRWVFGGKTHRKPAVSIELLIHNRQNGNTCFFNAKRQNVQDPDLGTVFGVESKITSPTNCVAGNCAADASWNVPAFVDANVRCVGCHVSGPYIATPLIAPYLAKDGLMNNGHDTLSSVSVADLSIPNKNVKYHAISALVNGVPGAFSQWDSLKQSYINPADSGCSIGCHLIGTKSPQGDIAPSAQQPTLLHGPASILTLIGDAQVMPPQYDDNSDYRWINLSSPVSGASGVDAETFAVAKNASTTLVQNLLNNCPAPGMMEAHVVGSDNVFLVNQSSRLALAPDRLSRFNVKDGLTCLNSDQDPGQTCSNYNLQYECTNSNTKVKTWVSWPAHALSSDGDREERNGANPCSSGSTATGIQAFFTLSNGWTYSAIGPNDRLANFSQYGLTCNNSDQPDGQCSNYVVRYRSCGIAPQTQPSKTLTNEYAIGKQLTAASGSVVKGQGHNSSWNTQQWNIEPIAYTEYVRVHNPGTNVYLTVTSTAESATVGTATYNTSTNEMWLIEPVANSADIRLKNLYSGKYLTIGDPKNFPNTPDYLPIFSQSRNTGWTSQRWLIQ